MCDFVYRRLSVYGYLYLVRLSKFLSISTLDISICLLTDMFRGREFCNVSGRGEGEREGKKKGIRSGVREGERERGGLIGCKGQVPRHGPPLLMTRPYS